MKRLCIVLLVFLGHQALANQKRKQQHPKLNSVSVENLDDQVEIGGETISGNIRQSSNCGAEYDSSSGTIRHPLNGGNYQNYEHCIWIIRASEPINITFDSFDTESSYDFLQVRDGESIGSPVLGDFTGVSVPSPVQTRTNAAYILFTSDYSVTRTGFELHWEPSGLNCGGEYNSSRGIIRHPLNGGHYQNDEHCIWIIRASEAITITFGNFDTEYSYDFLQVRDGESIGSPVLGDFSGVGVPSPVHTSTNAAYLLFTSDFSVTRTGFELHWEPSVPDCGGEYDSSRGTIRHPLNGGNYQNNEHCIWIIRASEPITITFDSFDTEFSYDFLLIRDGESIRSPDLGDFTGVSVPSPVQTSTNAAYLLFTSDFSVTRTGFELHWEPSGTSTTTTSSTTTPPITTRTLTTTTNSTATPPTTTRCVCGQPNRTPRIVNGTETEVNEYPWQAALVYSRSSSVFCGGSVIGSRHILTAAHCTQAVTDYSINYQVLLGAHGLTTAASSQLRLEATRIIQHSDYDSRTQDNDISIIELRDSISFTTSEVRPVCLPDSDTNAYDSVTATVSGWGVTEHGGDSPDVLLEVDVPTMSNTQCLSYYVRGITDNMLCAGYEEGGKDSCQGDSGGPLIYNSGSGYTQIGVVSWGRGCAWAEYPGVYARVTKYISWISTNTASSTTCSAA